MSAPDERQGVEGKAPQGCRAICSVYGFHAWDCPTRDLVETGAPDCRCPEGPSADRHREGEHACGRCGGFACGYAEKGKTRCPSWRCDCFIETHPDSPMDLHPEDFIVGPVLPPGGGRA